jgi:hypothetical protein
MVESYSSMTQQPLIAILVQKLGGLEKVQIEVVIAQKNLIGNENWELLKCTYFPMTIAESPMLFYCHPDLPDSGACTIKHLTIVMRLCHPPDGSTSPKYKLLCCKPP